MHDGRQCRLRSLRMRCSFSHGNNQQQALNDQRISQTTHRLTLPCLRKTSTINSESLVSAHSRVRLVSWLRFNAICTSWPLYFTQLAGDIPQPQRKLFDTLCSLPRPVIKVFAEQELGLAQYSSKRVIDLV